MAEIAPFAGVHYDTDRVAIERVIAPPYDVISPERQNRLYERDPHNIVRLILNRPEPEESEQASEVDRAAPYERAAAFLRDCLASGYLVQDHAPALYEYVQRFRDPAQPERRVERTALLVALRLEPYERGIVLPHEETHPKAKADRLELMRATQANPEPIFGLYEDPTLAVNRTLAAARKNATPLLQALSAPEEPLDGDHIVYRHDTPDLIAQVQAFLTGRRVWIADGHHRYETALNYARERRATDSASADQAQPYDYLLIGLSAFEDPGLVVLPTHRLVRGVDPHRLAELPLQLDRFFDVEPMPVAGVLEWIKEQSPALRRFAIVQADGAWGLTLRDLAVMDTAGEGHSPPWRRLDVTILQTLVLDRTLGISWQELAHTPDVAYTRDVSEAVARVRSGEFQLACLLQNPAVTEVRDVAAAGDKMPQKSTFFYPKLWSGLILRLLHVGRA